MGIIEVNWNVFLSMGGFIEEASKSFLNSMCFKSLVFA
jgi:hypothetical protein